jgi:murein DD-endopeptidase MepM/ murein hydrolase activator NlpD
MVVSSGWNDTFGYQVVVDHGFGIHTLYGHNSRNIVKEGDRVARGQTIAFVGSTGASTAPHLHFEVKKNGVPVDPRNYLLN